jgi:protoporphyrinogen oxidase
VRGKVAFGLYAGRCVTEPASRLKQREDVSAAEAWRRAGIPTDVVNGVLRPFFGGVLLEQGMTTSRRFTDLMMRMFVLGGSTVPARGMQRLPEVLAEALPAGCLRLGTPVRQLRPTRVDTDAGAVTARAVVVAADPWGAHDLLGGVVDGMPAPPQPRGVTTVYHAAPEARGSSDAGGILMVDSGASPVTNSVVISRAAPEYAPTGRMLVSSSMVHGGALPDPDGPEVRRALARLHATDTSTWEHVATYEIPRAQPGMPAPHPMRRPVRLASGVDTVYVAGDHRDTSSIQGALVSGRRAAEAVLADLGVAR